MTSPAAASPHDRSTRSSGWAGEPKARSGDLYFSADVETDGPIPGPYSMLSFALVPAGSFDGQVFHRASADEAPFYIELRPISDEFDPEALAVNGLDRAGLLDHGSDPAQAMRAASAWIESRCAGGTPVLVAYPLSFDWSWLYWYFIRFTGSSPFRHSRCFDLKTAVAVTRGVPISAAGRKQLPPELRSQRPNTHHATDDARAQAEIFAKLFEARMTQRGG